MSVAVTFLPHDVTVDVEPGITVLEAARAAAVHIASPCGGRGVCGACAVRVVSGVLAPADEAESAGLARSGADVRLACRARIRGPVTVKLMNAPGRSDAGTVPAVSGSLVAAVDLGTTTVTASVMDRATGVVRGTATVANLQGSWGADVLSRVAAAVSGEAAAIRDAAERSVILALADAAGGSTTSIEHVVIAANSAMMTLLTGVDGTSLATAPFHAPSGASQVPADSGIRRAVSLGAAIELVPLIGAFVGGDALAAALACGMLVDGDRSLLIDLGTNAEIVLSGPDGLVAASAPAGPAFEAVGLSCGGPAITGAVSRVCIDDARGVRLTVIGGGEPRWLSGSGYISALAELTRCEMVGANGLLTSRGTDRLPVVTDASGVRSVVLSEGIAISQLDIRAIQLAKAAVRVGVTALLREAGSGKEYPSRVLVTGAFGAAITPDDLVGIGIVPTDMLDRIEVVPAAALEGARMCVLDPETLKSLGDVAQRSRVLDLPATAGFSESLMGALELTGFLL